MSTPETARETVVLARESVSVVAWLEHLLHPWTSFVIVPLFALANAGVVLSASTRGATPLTSRITYGVVVGLVVGKLVGISLFAWLAVRVRVGVLPDGGRDGRGIVGRGGGGRHRLHRVDLRDRPGLRRPRPPGPGQDRHPGGVAGGRRPRRLPRAAGGRRAAGRVAAGGQSVR